MVRCILTACSYIQLGLLTDLCTGRNYSTSFADFTPGWISITVFRNQESHTWLLWKELIPYETDETAIDLFKLKCVFLGELDYLKCWTLNTALHWFGPVRPGAPCPCSGRPNVIHNVIHQAAECSAVYGCRSKGPVRSTNQPGYSSIAGPLAVLCTACSSA